MIYTKFDGNNPFGSQAKMLKHMDRLWEYTSKGDTKPIFMEINLTSKCNLNCSWCISGNFDRATTLSTWASGKFLYEFKDYGGKAVTFSGGGEPTLHPDFTDILFSAQYNELDVGLMTNGTFKPDHRKVIDRVCSWVRFSLDTVSPVKYKQWKGVDRVEEVLENIKNLHKTKVGVNCNVGPEHTIEDVDELIETVGPYANYIQFRPILPRYFMDERPYVSRIFDHLKNMENGNINLSRDKVDDLESGRFFPFSSCEGHFFSPILDSNGNVCVCMYHPNDERFVFGNIYKHSFSHIWESQKRKDVIEFVRNLCYREKCQMCCKLTELNKLIEFVKKDEVVDVNFL